MRLLLGMRKIAYRGIGRGEAPVFAAPSTLRRYAKTIEKAVIRHDLETVVFNQLFPMAYLPHFKDTRLVAHIDATFAGLTSLGGYVDLWRKRDRESLIEHEALAADRADAIYCASEWAAQSVREDYGVSSHKVHVSAMGANVDGAWPVDRPAPEAREPTKLVFFGGGWERKGGPMALDVLLHLRTRGMDAELVVLGPATDVIGTAHPGSARYIGRLDKADPVRVMAVKREIADAALFILPTLADCSPAAVSELAALGVPAMVRDVGGVASTVIDGVTGVVLPASAIASDWATKAQEIIENRELLQRMRASALARYTSKLNWPAIMQEVVE
jgi:glycosyltransferase involved in cell wall biosynthesis